MSPGEFMWFGIGCLVGVVFMIVLLNTMWRR